ncbi:Cysteine protease atg4 [Aspergillus wentii]
MNSIDIGRCKRIVQYLWDPEPKNDEGPDIPIWCLGRKYAQPAVLEGKHRPSTPLSANEGNPVEQSTTSHDSTDNGWPEAFLTDLESKIWMTYRSNFAPIPRPDKHDRNPSMSLGIRLRNQLMDSQGFTSDTGWGCMIRSGQSLLANCLLILTLGRDWRRGENRKEELQLLSLFIDLPEAPFSIHQFVKHGAESCSKYPGEWFGPSATAKCIQILSSQCEQLKLRVYVTNDTSDVYQDKFMSIACDDSGRINPTLILLGIRLGIDHITPVYWDGLRAVLQYPQSVGIAGYVHNLTPTTAYVTLNINTWEHLQ